MKKLKLQTVLLAICLALATSLIINNGTNGMDAHTTSNQIQWDNAIETLTKQDYRQFAKGYIKDDPVRYLALLIQSANGIIKLPATLRSSKNITSYFIYKTLFENTLDYIENKETMFDEEENSHWELITTYLRHLQQLENRGTATEHILRLILLPKFPKQGHATTLRQLHRLIESYQEQNFSIEDEQYSSFLSLLDKVSQLLMREASRLTNSVAKRPLANLGQLINTFSKEYEYKRKNSNNNSKNTNNKYAQGSGKVQDRPNSTIIGKKTKRSIDENEQNWGQDILANNEDNKYVNGNIEVQGTGEVESKSNYIETKKTRSRY